MAKRMNDDALLALARQEIEYAQIDGRSVIAEQRIVSQNIYTGVTEGSKFRPPKDSSALLLNEHFDYTNRLSSYLLNGVAADKEVVTFSTRNSQKADAGRQLQEMVNHSMMKTNCGFSIMEDWIRASLISKNGIIKFFWDESPHVFKLEEVEVQGDIEQYIAQEQQRYGSDVDIDILERPSSSQSNEEEFYEDEAGNLIPIPQDAPSGSYTLRYTCYGKPVWETVPREEFVHNVELVSLSDELCRFVAHRREVMVGDVVDMYPEYFKKLKRKMKGSTLQDVAQSVAGDGSETHNFEYDFERISRFAFDGTYDNQATDESTDPMSRRVALVEGYYRVDYEGDGRMVWLKLVWAGNHIFEKQVVEMHPFTSYAPFPVPHKFDGLSTLDVIGSTMLGMTGLMRSRINNVLQQNTVRWFEFGKTSAGKQISSGQSGPIRVKNTVSGQQPIVPIQAPPGAQDTVALLEYLDRKIQAKLGISSTNDGTNVDLAKSGNSEAKLQLATSLSTQAVETYLRRLAETGIRDVVWGFVSMMRDNADSYYVRNLIEKLYGPDMPFLAVDNEITIDKDDLMAKVGIGHKTPQEKAMAFQETFQIMGALEASGVPIPPQKKLKWGHDAIKNTGIDDVFSYLPSDEEFQQFMQQQQEAHAAQAEEAAAQARAETETVVLENEETKSKTVLNYAKAEGEKVDALKPIAELANERPYRTQ